MKKLPIKVLITTSIILFSSCERDVNNVKLPAFDKKLVVNSFISPRDTLSIVSVTSNKRLYGILDPMEAEKVGNVSVLLSDGTKEINLIKTEDGFIFRRKDMQIEEGKTYTLSVSSDLGLQAEASSTIPFRRPLKIEADTSSTFYDYGDGTGNGWKQFMVDVYITDYPGEENYYACTGKQVLFNSEYSYYPYHFELYNYGSAVFTDKGKDGERIFVNNFSYNDASRDDSSDLVIYILNTDKDYYTYHHALDNYSSGGDPFTEISPAWSNIKGGLGIFASYVVDSLVLKVK